MASALIKSIRSLTGEQPPHRRLFEAVTQSFLQGVPVEIDGTGGVIEWDTTVAAKIAGISCEAGSSLVTIKVPKTTTEGSVQNQTLAVSIPRGAKMNDARIGVDLPVASTVFYGQVKSDQTPADTDVGVNYGLTKDTDNHWFVDKTKVGANAVLTIVKLDPYDSRGVHFVFMPAAVQLPG